MGTEESGPTSWLKARGRTPFDGGNAGVHARLPGLRRGKAGRHLRRDAGKRGLP